MQTSNRNLWILTKLFFLFFSIGSMTALAYDDATIQEATKAYENGFELFQQEHWRDAAESLQTSYNMVPFPVTAYLISVSYSRMGDASNALEFARNAIDGQPPLEEPLRMQHKLSEPYISEANRIVVWAEEYQETVRLEGKADCPDCPAPPPPPPPPSKLKIPGSSRFPQASQPREPNSLLRGIHTIQQKSNGRYMDAHEGTHDNSIVTRDRQNNATQRWILTHLGGNIYTIQQQSNGRYVDAYEGSHDNSLVTRNWQNNDTQRWIIK